MSSRIARRAAFLALMVALFPTSPAHAGWNSDPVQVHASSAHISQVSAADDGQSGAIVVWQEDRATGGSLRAQHLLSTGDVDPAWPASGVAVSTRDAARAAVGVVTDAAGGAYVWWTEGTSLYLSRVASSGAIAAGWPATGRFLATLYRSTDRPVVVPDHQGGVIAAWLQFSQFPLSDPTGTVRVIRYGPQNVVAAGWPAGGRAFGAVGLTNPTVVSFAIDSAPDGGVWLVWTAVDKGPQFAALDGEHRAVRLAPTGLPAPSWTSAGIVLDTFQGSLLNSVGWLGYLPTSFQFVSVASDGGSGAFVLTEDGLQDESAIAFRAAVHRIFDLDGSSFGAPPPILLADFLTPPGDPGLAPIARLLSDARGGFYLGLPEFGSEFFAGISFQHRDGLGGAGPGGVGAEQRGLEFAARGDGGMFIASFKPSGATSPYDSDAYVRVAQSAGPSFVESQRSFSAVRYGDIGLASTGDGGAIFAWSQELDRHGVFAIRLGAVGQVTDVPPPVAGRVDLRAHFARGRGVLAQVTIPGALQTDLVLLDVQGRVESMLSAAGNSTLEAAFPGTAMLSSGVYFVRASGAGQQLTRRVVVLR